MKTRRLAQLIGPARLERLKALLVRLVEYGTHAYAPEIRTRLKILNVVAYLIAVFTLIYAIQYAFKGFSKFAPLVYLNLTVVAVALLVPFAHRFSDIAGALLIALAEFAALFIFTLMLGRSSGIQLQYFACPAAFFVIFGLERVRLILLLTVLGAALHLLAWFSLPEEAALIPVDEGEHNSLYVTAALTTFTMIAAVVYYAFRLAEQAQGETEALLRNILPESIVNRLRAKPEVAIADSIEEASVLFADLEGFVPLAKMLGPERTVALLNEMMQRFDRLAATHGVEKIKTIGDAYMVAAGVPEPVADHALRLARMGLAMLQAAEQLSKELGVSLHLRIGIASGPVMAGVIGAKRLTYDVWGDTVNLASRLERQSQPGRVLVAKATKARLEGLFELEPLGAVDLKGLGEEQAWFLGRPRDGRSGPAPRERPGNVSREAGKRPVVESGKPKIV
jgi:adenylate cyclase